jgi:hypothetical protein
MKQGKQQERRARDVHGVGEHLRFAGAPHRERQDEAHEDDGEAQTRS